MFFMLLLLKPCRLQHLRIGQHLLLIPHENPSQSLCHCPLQRVHLGWLFSYRDDTLVNVRLSDMPSLIIVLNVVG